MHYVVKDEDVFQDTVITAYASTLIQGDISRQRNSLMFWKVLLLAF